MFYDIICSQPQITEPLWLNLGILDMDGRNREQSVGAVFAHPQTHCLLQNRDGLDTYHVQLYTFGSKVNFNTSDKNTKRKKDRKKKRKKNQNKKIVILL